MKHVQKASRLIHNFFIMAPTDLDIITILYIHFFSVSHFLIDNMEQWICIRFCQNLGKPFSETFEMLKEAYRHDAAKHKVFDWHCCFKEERTSNKTDEHPAEKKSMLKQLKRCTVWWSQIREFQINMATNLFQYLDKQCILFENHNKKL